MGAMNEIKVPDIGDFKEVDVIELLAKPGDRVSAEQSLITVESDKATMEIPSPISGVLKELKVKIGDKVSDFPEAKQPQVTAAVRRLVLSAWDLDFYGDLGNKEKITEAFNSFAAAAADIKAGYGASR